MRIENYLQPFLPRLTVYACLQELIDLREAAGEEESHQSLCDVDIPELSALMGGAPSGLVLGLQTAQRTYLEEASKIEALLLAKGTAQAWSLVKQHLGLVAGDIIVWTDSNVRPQRQSFELEDVYLTLYPGYPNLTTISLLGSDATDHEETASHCVTFSCFMEAQRALSGLAYLSYAPSEMTLRALQQELTSVYDLMRAENWGATAYWRQCGDTLALMRALDTGTFPMDDVLQSSSHPVDAIYLSLSITSKGNLVLEWRTAPLELDHEPTVASALGQHRPRRLFQVTVDHLYDPRGHRNLPRGTGTHLDRIRDLVAHGVVAVARACIERMKENFNVVNEVPLPIVEYRQDAPGLAGVALVPCNAAHMDASTDNSHLEIACQFSSAGLRLITPYNWRQETWTRDKKWAAVLADAGGAVLPVPFSKDLKQQLVDFYKARDPEVREELLRLRKLEAQKAHQEKVFAQEHKLPNARAFILSLKIGDKTGWSKALAEHLGIQDANVKRWLKQNLPDVVGALYPGMSRVSKARSLSASP